MAGKRKETARVIAQTSLAAGIYDLRIVTTLARQAHCGQFVALYPKDKSTLLPRPISICEADQKQQILRLVYRVAGQGTAAFSELKAGDVLDVLGVLGNGFPVSEAKPGMTALLVGGGVGVPPIVQLAKELTCEKRIVAGYRDSQCFLREDFERAAGAQNVYLAALCRCFGRSSNMPSGKRSRRICRWRNGWPAGWEPVWAASAKPRRWTPIPM